MAPPPRGESWFQCLVVPLALLLLLGLLWAGGVPVLFALAQWARLEWLLVVLFFIPFACILFQALNPTPPETPFVPCRPGCPGEGACPDHAPAKETA